MGDAEEIQRYQDLSRQYLASAQQAARAGNLAPAYHNALHALELAVKAALAARLPRVPRTHNVGGLLGQEFRDVLGGATCSRISQLLHASDEPRYPGWEPPAEIDSDLAFIAGFIEVELPRLVKGARA